MIILRQKGFGYVSKERAAEFFTKTGNTKGINTLQSLRGIPVAPKGGNPKTKGNLEHDKRNYKIRNFRLHELKKSPDSLQDKQRVKNLKTAFKTNKPVNVGIFE